MRYFIGIVILTVGVASVMMLGFAINPTPSSWEKESRLVSTYEDMVAAEAGTIIYNSVEPFRVTFGTEVFEGTHNSGSYRIEREIPAGFYMKLVDHQSSVSVTGVPLMLRSGISETSAGFSILALITITIIAAFCFVVIFE